MSAARLACWAVALAACGTQATPASDVAADVAEVADIGLVADAESQGDAAEVAPDGVAADTAVSDASAPPALGDRPGLAVWARALVNTSDGALDGLWLEVEVEGEAHPLGADPAGPPPLWRVPPPGGGSPALAQIATWSLEAGEAVALEGDPWLLARAPGAASIAVRARVWRRDGAGADALSTEGEARFVVGEGPALLRATPEDAPVALWLEAEAGVGGFGAEVAAGLLLSGRPAGVTAEVDDFIAGLGGRLLHIKHYHGARPHLVRPGCESDTQCGEGGESHPCVSVCACACTVEACDCDLSGIEASMRARALGAARGVMGEEAAVEALSQVRIHYVIKRSLGGTTRCEESGELDVSPATYGAFFREVVAAAHRINVEVGFRLIDSLSPQNESNHPLQDGSHRDGSGGAALGGEGIGLAYAEVIERQSCLNGRCCPAHRYVVADPDVPALLAAALVRAREYRDEAAAGPHGALVPDVGMSLYLDVERTDPIAVDDDGEHPSIVTPVPRFLDALAAALEATPGGAASLERWAGAHLFVDTYPGSWAPPWFTTEDDLVQHFDPERGEVMRHEAVAAADRVMARARAAADAFEARFGERPRYVLGEVGWSTFDRDEAAQARFIRRIFARAAELGEADPAFGGFVYFKDTDRGEPTYPTWVDGLDPFSGERVACDLWFLSRLVCATELFAEMEGQWGLFRRAGEGYAAKPGWAAFVAAFRAYVPEPTTGP